MSSLQRNDALDIEGRPVIGLEFVTTGVWPIIGLRLGAV